MTSVSRETAVPVSTLFEWLQRWPALRRATLLLDFAQLGLTHAWLLVGGVPRARLGELEAFLAGHRGVNTVQRVMTEAEFLVEVVVPDARAVEDFVDRLHLVFRVGSVRILYVLADVRREGYLTDAVCTRS